jgi:hypothetical protein
MKQITMNLENLAEAMIVSYEFNSQEEHRGALAMLRMIINNDEIYKKVGEMAEKIYAEKKNNKK